MMNAICPGCGVEYVLERERVLPLMVEKPELFKQKPGKEEMYADVECWWCETMKKKPINPFDTNQWKPSDITIEPSTIIWTMTTTQTLPPATITWPYDNGSSKTSDAVLTAKPPLAADGSGWVSTDTNITYQMQAGVWTAVLSPSYTMLYP